MEKNTTSGITYFIKISKAHKTDLLQIRHWSQLKVALDQEDNYWVSNLNEENITNVAVTTLPHKTLFYEKDNLLFLLGHNTPECKAPSQLLWSPINSALPLEYPVLNHNYFGMSHTVVPKLISSNEAQETKALLTTISHLERYITTAPKFRLESLRWIVLNQTQVLIYGTPIVPIPGTTYWEKDDFLFPSGYCLEFQITLPLLKKQLNPTNERFILWDDDGNIITLPKDHFKPLSISSFRLTQSTL